MTRTLKTLGKATACAAIIAATGLATLSPASAQLLRQDDGADDAATYYFSPGAAIDRNFMYGVNRATGEVKACWFEPDNNVGLTTCAQTGPGAGPQGSGMYRLVPSNMENEPGVFRVDMESGAIAICYVASGQVVCTPSS